MCVSEESMFFNDLLLGEKKKKKRIAHLTIAYLNGLFITYVLVQRSCRKNL